MSVTRAKASPYLPATSLQTGVAAVLAQRAARSTMRYLWDAEVSVFSQWGEDGILDYLCEALDLPRPRCLELGAATFRECNTRFLADYRCASVLAVDARSELTPSVRSLPTAWRTTVLPVQQFVTISNGAELAERARRAFGGLDIISIDLDGNDYWILENFDLAGVRIVVVEYNSLFGSLMPVAIPPDDSFSRQTAHYSWQYYGASIRSFVDLLAERGFTFVGTNRPGTNAFFVDVNSAEQVHVRPRSAELSPFVDFRVREARDASGRLSFEVADTLASAIGDMPLVNTADHSKTTVIAAYRAGSES